MHSGSFHHSSHFGAFTARVVAGNLVAADAHALDEGPAALLDSVPESSRSRARVTHPVVRRSWLEGGPGARTDRRGRDDFVEVTWDQALTLVADELVRVKEQWGNASIFGGSYGWSSAGRFHHAKTQVNRFLGCFGGYTAQQGNYSYAAAMQILPHVLGDAATTTGDVTSFDVLEQHTTLWVMFGGTPLRNTQVEAGGVVNHGARRWLERIRRSGTDFVSVTPIRDDAPDLLDAQWVAPRPNTDTALMMGMVHSLVTENLHSQEFLDRYCVGWDRLHAYLMGDVDGVPKSAEWAAGICDIPATEIRDLAVRMAANRTMLSAAWSLQRAEHGEQPFWMLIALAAALGQIGLPGGGFGFGYGGAATIGWRGERFGGPSLPTGPNPADSFIPVARIADMMLHPGGSYDFDGQRRTYPDIRLVYWAGGNPFHHHQDLNRLERAWQRPETVIVHEQYWTATARRADIVLPATITLERNDIAASARDRYFVAMHQALEPWGEARDDYAIFTDLAHRLGIGQPFTEGRDVDQWLRNMWDHACERARASGVQLPGFDDFWTVGHAEFPAEAQHILLEPFRAHPDANALRTPSGKIELFSETIDAFGYDDCPGHPTWMPPVEWLGADLAEQFPLHLISNQPRTRLHSQLDTGPVSLASKIQGREPCRLNPDDAAARNIRAGDVVRIFNGRGACLAGAVLDDGIRRGVVQLATGAWYDPVELDGSRLDMHGNPNALTADRGTSRLAQGPSAHSALVQIERFDGAPPGPSVHEPPAISDR